MPTLDAHAILTPRLALKRAQYLQLFRSGAEKCAMGGNTNSDGIAKTGDLRFRLGAPLRSQDAWIAQFQKPDGVTLGELVAWLHEQRNRRVDGRRELARSTVHAYSQVLQRYARAALSADLLYNNAYAESLREAFRPFRSPRRRFSDIEPLSRREVRAMLDPGQAGERVAALVAFLLHTGLRASEACAITSRDWTLVDRRDSDGETIGRQYRIKVRGKVEDRSIFCSEDVFAQVRQLSGGSKYLFLTERGTQYGRQSLYLILSHAGRRVIGRTVGCHLLRHTYATFMHQAGKDAEAMRQMGISADVFYSTYIYARPEPLTEFSLKPQVSVAARDHETCEPMLTTKRRKLG